ncbi:MAG: hypothetical protein QOE77_4207 [Blastocatellia bacterium]|nr:hypothetical protein [Blastocatellia bacterium]
MNVFFLDLWHDLKEKRLWPVAVVLLAALIAVPVLLAKPAAKSSAPASSANATGPKPDVLKQLAKVTLGDDQAGDGSTLGAFDPSNPFNPPKGAIKKEGATTATAGPTTATPGGSSAPTIDGGGGGASPGSGITGDVPGGGDNGGGGPTTTTAVYKYVVDLTFKTNGVTRHIKGMEKLDMLPNQSSPLLIFLGVTPQGSNAVFLVDSTLKAAGEGKCKPSASKCAFAYIGAGSQYIFTEDDGDSYTVRIDEIRKVKVGAGANSAKAKGAKAHASLGPNRRFVPPVVADLVVVASETTQNSDTDTESR